MDMESLLGVLIAVLASGSMVAAAAMLVVYRRNIKRRRKERRAKIDLFQRTEAAAD